MKLCDLVGAGYGKVQYLTEEEGIFLDKNGSNRVNRN